MKRLLGVDETGRELWVEYTEPYACKACDWRGQRSPMDLIPTADCPHCGGHDTLARER